MLSRLRFWLVLGSLSVVCSCSSLGFDPPVRATTASPTPTASVVEPSPEPRFSISVGSQTRSWTRSELLKHPEARSQSVLDHSAYEGRKIDYRVIPVSALFEGIEIPKGSTLTYDTTDGFSSSIEPSLLLSEEPGSSVALLAIEDPSTPWPTFDNREYGAGPFYLVWDRPEASNIGREEWPFKLVAFREEPPIESRFPAVPPATDLDSSHPAHSGYRLFIRNCFPCHTVNGQGTAAFGPDLNHPMSPTEYMSAGMIQKLVRDPQSVRQWKGGKMPGFGPKVISDAELEDIVAYLTHKAETR